MARSLRAERWVATACSTRLQPQQQRLLGRVAFDFLQANQAFVEFADGHRWDCGLGKLGALG